MIFKSSQQYKFDYLLNLFKNDYDDCINFCKEMLKLKSIKSNKEDIYFWECLIIDFENNKEFNLKVEKYSKELILKFIKNNNNISLNKFKKYKKYALICVNEILMDDVYDMSEEIFNKRIEFYEAVENRIKNILLSELK